MSTILPRFKLTNQISAWRDGQGPHLILVHGVGLSADAWYAMLPELTKHFTVTSIDMPGHGESAALVKGKDTSLSDYTDTIADATATIEEPIMVVGHSMGALIAMDLAISHPEKIAAAVPINAIFRRSQDAAKAVQSRAVELTSGKTFDNKPTLERWFGTNPEGMMREARERCDTMLRSADPEGYAAAYNIFAHEDGPADDALKSCNVPMLFITGSDEPNSTPQMSVNLATIAPNGSCEIIKHARHMMPITHADHVNKHIIAFVQNKVRHIA